jgi:hypothetical protein
MGCRYVPAVGGYPPSEVSGGGGVGLTLCRNVQ